MFNELLDNFTISNFTESERLVTYEASFVFLKEKALDYDFFVKMINDVNYRDSVKILLEDINERTFIIKKDNLNIKDKYDEYIKNVLDDEEINVNIKIKKNVIDNRFSVYAYEKFIDDILSLDIDSVMSSFSELLKKTSNHLIFEVYDTKTVFSTRTMFFLPHESEMIDSEVDRKLLIKRCKENSYFYNFNNFEIIPDDFKIVVNYRNNKLTDLFDKITTILSLGYISTSFDINAGKIKGSIQGNRLIEYDCELNSIFKNNILYDIYNWIYTDGSHIDKAIIARNVICLHCKYVSILNLDDNTLAAIQSNYNLYLKDNVKEYLELVNKMSEFIRDTISRTGEYATKLLDKFKSNIIAIFGFLFSVVLANIVSLNPLDNIFTEEITSLFEWVIISSFIYLYINYLQSKIEVEKALDSYLLLKENYKNILSEKDINEIFNEEKNYKEIKVEIQKKQKFYLIIWMSALIIFLISIGYLGGFPYCNNLINLFKK